MPLSTQLRRRTACLHKQTEVLLGLPGAIQTLNDYGRWISWFLGLYEPLEQSLARFSEWGDSGRIRPSFSLRARLIADLQAIGVDPNRVPRAPTTIVPQLPTFSHALGALYVLEGSALGGRMILRDVEARIGQQITGATQFFPAARRSHGGPNLGRPSKQHWTPSEIESPDLRANVVSGAESVFDAIMPSLVRPPLREDRSVMSCGQAMDMQRANPEPDLSSCELEPIHIPGAIQPHGAVVVALAEGLVVSHASANLETFLGRPAETVLGRPLHEVIGKAAERELQSPGALRGMAAGQVLSLPGLDRRALDLRAHRSADYICIDVEPIRHDPQRKPPIILAQSILETFKYATTRIELCELAVAGLRAITGFVRVMAYHRFHTMRGTAEN